MDLVSLDSAERTVVSNVGRLVLLEARAKGSHLRSHEPPSLASETGGSKTSMSFTMFLMGRNRTAKAGEEKNNSNIAAALYCLVLLSEGVYTYVSQNKIYT